MSPTPANPPPATGSAAPDPVTRRRAAALAGHAGDKSTATALLADPDPGVRAAAVGALARCDAIDAAISNQMADDPEPGVRRRLAEELGRNRPTDPAPRAQALQVALRLVHDADPMVAEAAAWSIGELAGPAPDDPTDLDALDDLDAPDAPDDPDAPGELDAPGHRPVSDDDHAMDPDAASGSDETTEVTVVLADVATTHPDALVRESAVAAVGAIGNVAGLPAVLHATSDKPAVRRRAVIALASFLGQPGVDEALQRATADRDWQVRQAADMLLESDD